MNGILQLLPPVAVYGAMWLFAFIEARYPPAEKPARKCYQFLAVVLWPVALIFFGDFRLRQGIVLGLMLAWLAHHLGRTVAKPTQVFTPYRVWVRPNWFKIATDFRLLRPEEWGSVPAAVASSTGYSVARDGLRFTVVQQSEDLKNTLIFQDSYPSFACEVDFERSMESIRLPFDPNANLDLLREPHAVLFFMKLGRGRELPGYDLGICVPLRWWDSVKNSCPQPIRENPLEQTGQIEITLATLSYREFDSYWKPADADEEGREKYIFKTLPQQMKRRDEQRLALGWTADKHGGEDFIPYRGWPEFLHHRYFDFEHRAI